MSHYTRVRTRLTDGHVLVEALRAMGFKSPELHSLPQPLVGYRGDRRNQTAEVIVRRKEVGRASNDIGFARRGDGTYEAIISEFDSRKYNAAWLSRLDHAYAVAGVKQFARDGGFEIAETETEKGGTVRLVLRRGT